MDHFLLLHAAVARQVHQELLQTAERQRSYGPTRAGPGPGRVFSVLRRRRRLARLQAAAPPPGALVPWGTR